MGKMIRLAVAVLAFALVAPRAEAQEKAPATPAAKPSPLKAAAKEYSFEIRPTIGLVIPLAPSGSVGWDIGGSFRAKPPSWPVGVQLDIIWIDLSSSIFQFTVNGVYEFTTESHTLEPYAIAGLGMYDGNFGLNIGAGADFAISGSPIGFFAEARFHAVFNPGDNLNLLPINAGVRIQF
jgi:hypothetical protein